MKVDINEVIEKYVALRDRKSEIKAEYELRVAAINATLEKAEGLLLQHMQNNGVESMRAMSGTVYSRREVSATVGDWDSFLHFVQEHDAYHMLERRCSKTAVEEYKTAHADLPPGINWRESITVGVRRAPPGKASAATDE